MKRSLVLRTAAALSVALATGHADAAVPNEVDLQTVFRLVREVSPRLALERSGIAQAEADRITAGAYPNPTLTLGQARPSSGARTIFDARSQSDASVELPLLIAGQRAARIERAERAIDAARARVAAGSSTLSAEAGAAFVTLLAAQEKSAVLSAAGAEVFRLRDIVAGREASGAASRYDLTRLDVEMSGLRAKLEDAKADVAERSGSLAALLGLPDWHPSAVGTLAPLDEPPRRATPSEYALAAPASIAAAREQEAAESAVEVARRERWPVPALSLGRVWTNDPFGAANRLGVTVEVPIFDTRRGPLARAEAEAGAAALKRSLVAAELTANVNKLREVVSARRTALAEFDRNAATRLPALKQMAEDAYRLGRTSILELLDATRSRYELQQIRVDLAAALLEAQVRLAALAAPPAP